MAVLVVECAQFLVGAHPGVFEPVPDHADHIQLPDAVGGHGAAVASGALGGQPGPEPEPAGGDERGGDVEVAVLVVVGAGVAVAVPPGGCGAVDDADPQRVQGPGQRAVGGLHGDLRGQLLPARPAAAVWGPAGAGGAQPGAECFVVRAQRADDAQHVLVPAAVAGDIAIAGASSPGPSGSRAGTMIVAVSASPWGRSARPAIWMMSMTDSFGAANRTESMAGTSIIWSCKVSSQLAPVHYVQPR